MDHWRAGHFICRRRNVPISVRIEAGSELKFRLAHSGTRMVIVSKNQAAKIESIAGELPELEKIIHLDPKNDPAVNDLDYRNILEKGKDYLQNNYAEFEAVYKSILPDDLANISYTSGTTADPKGIMLSHRNYATNVIQANTLMEIDPTWKTLAFLPWDHAFAHTACLYCFIYNGASIASLELGKTPLETLKNIPKNIREIKPDMLMSVPAIAKNFRKNIESGIREKGSFVQLLFNHALTIAYRYNGTGNNRGKGFKKLLRPLLTIYDKILFSKIREGFGGNMKLFIGGGALLDIELQKFFYAIGIPMCQGYGLSEASPVISSNALHTIKFGSSGKLVKYLDLKIVDNNGSEVPAGHEGEIIVKGDNVMQGYWNNPAATAETLRDGWLYTGDMGYVDLEGYLYVLGRYKSLLIGNDGEKFSPESIEEALVNHSAFIDQCVLYNNQNPYTVALIVPNIAELDNEARKHGLSLKSDEGLARALRAIQHDLAAFGKDGKYERLFPERWIPSTIAILPESFSEQNHLVNSTMKLVRGRIYEYFREPLEFLYTPEARNIINPRNLEALKKWGDPA